MNNYSLKIFTDLDSCARHWEYLENAAPCHPFQSSIWCRTLVEAFGENCGQQLRICVLLGENDEPLLLAPLQMKRRGPLRVAVFLDNGLADLNCPLLAPDARIDDVGELLKLLLDSLHCDILEFSKIPPVLADGRANPFAALCKGKHSMAYHSVTLDEGWDTFLATRIKGRFRRKDRKAWNELSRKGAVAFEVAENGSRALEMTQKLIEFKQDWMHNKQVSGVIDTQAAHQFMSRLAEAGQAYLCALTVNGEILAAIWCQIRQERIYALVTSYDMNYAKCSPGRLVLHELIRTCFASGYRRFEMGIGDEDFKIRLADKSLELYRHSAAGSLLGIPCVAWFRIKDTVAHHPRLRALAKGLRKRYHAWSGGEG